MEFLTWRKEQASSLITSFWSHKYLFTQNGTAPTGKTEKRMIGVQCFFKKKFERSFVVLPNVKNFYFSQKEILVWPAQ